MNDELLKRLQGVEKELGALAAHEHANVSEFMRDPTTTAGDLIVLWGLDTTNYAASSRGAVATASSVFSAYYASRAIDSDDGTEWAAVNAVGEWIYVDLQIAVTIGRYRILQGRCDSFKISYSDDHTTWTDVGIYPVISADQTGTFAAATARYWRFENITGGIGGGWLVSSLELYSPAGVHTLVPLHAVANIGYVLGIGTDGFPAYLPSATPAAHKTSHENGGADEISVAGLSGVLADAQTPKAHNQAATTVTVADAANYYTGTEAETVLQEVGTDNAASIHDNVGGEIDALTALTLPVMGDLLLAESSAESFAKRELSLASLSLLKNDLPLKSATEGDAFIQYANAAPTGWANVGTAPVYSKTDKTYSYWFLEASATYNAYDYRKITGVAPGTDNVFHSFYWSNILLRDGQYTADLTYNFEICADDGAGTINTAIYNRIELMWDASIALWKMRGAGGDGSTTYTGSYYVIPYLANRLYFRLVVSLKTFRMYASWDAQVGIENMIGTKTWTVAPEFNTVWRRFYISRGAGLNDRIMIGNIDYDTGNA